MLASPLAEARRRFEPLTHAELQAIAAEPYERRGILHSEMALIIHICRHHRIERVIESGRARAQSTEMLAKYLPDCQIQSFDMRGETDDEAFARERLAPYANVELHVGDGRLLVPLAASLSACPTAILLDGPKGAAAVELLQDCFSWPEIRVGFIHDMRRLDHGEPSPHRAAALDAFPRAQFSDEPALIAGSSWMDETILSAGGPCGPAHEAEFGSYGPTIGVFLNPSYKQ